jgi:chemotaxis methyl-accepting protein methylase
MSKTIASGVRLTSAWLKKLQVQTLEKIVSRLRPGGILVIGKQETLPTTTAKLVEIHPRTGLYQKLGP